MTEEPSPAGDRRDPGRQPSLRASHAHRDRTVEVLRDAAGDGRLTASELDERVEAALTARTGSELAALTADLPAEPGRQPKELVRIDQRFGEVARTGSRDAHSGSGCDVNHLAGNRQPADAVAQLTAAAGQQPLPRVFLLRRGPVSYAIQPLEILSPTPSTSPIGVNGVADRTKDLSMA